MPIGANPKREFKSLVRNKPDRRSPRGHIIDEPRPNSDDGILR